MEGTTFDTNHPLAKTIIKGCKQGSPVDCFVISHDFELMGSLDYNQFLDDLDEYDNDQQSDEYKNSIDALTKYWGIFPGNTAQLKYKFDQGQHFKLCATGDQWGGIDTINAFNATVSIETN